MLQTIKLGTNGKPVMIVQYLIGGAAIGKAGGSFDEALVQAVKSFQGRFRLGVDGIVGPKTWTQLARSAPTCSTSKNRKSPATCALQTALANGLNADGIYGKQTKAAVVAYQSARGLKADGICGPKTWAALLTGAEVATNTAGFKQPVDYKQGDSRWGKKNYTSTGNKSQTMSNSGCGPTAMADIVATLIDPAVTPWTLAQLAMQWGDRTASSGTAWSFYNHIQEHYKFSKMVGTTSLETLKACLDAGGYAVCSMGPGYWTKGGHFITAWKYDATYIYCNDPASSSRKKQKQTDFLKQRKKFFCFYK